MKKMFLGPAGMIFMVGVAMTTPVVAAELLDVKPVVSGSSTTIEVTADIPMTYTYYNVPGQARAVVDIADADCEKVEPLIVVNKGAVASISVDKAVISGMTVSRLIFNLTSSADIVVTPQPDRKKILIAFGGAAPTVAAATPAPAVQAAPVEKPAAKPVAEIAPPPAPAASADDDDPLGLNEPKSAAAPAASVKPEPVKAKPASYPAVRSSRIEPVVPVETSSSASVTSVVKGIVIGSSHVDILANGRVESFKQLKLGKPERLVIDIPGTHTVKNKSIAVNKFGISKIRVGSNAGFTRVVLDISSSPLPLYEIASVDDGLRITFK
jgi:hypothetical protein